MKIPSTKTEHRAVNALEVIIDNHSTMEHQFVKAGPDCPEIDGDFCHQIAGKPAGSSLPPAGLVHENSHSNTTFTA